MHHSQTGYYVTFVRYNGKPKRVMIHRAVAECWLGECPQDYEVDHIDRNSHNNHYTNLRYVTKSQQMKNRDHSKISKRGVENLERARRERAKPVKACNDYEEYVFDSYADASRFLARKCNSEFEKIRYRLRRGYNEIFQYSIEYLS